MVKRKIFLNMEPKKKKTAKKKVAKRTAKKKPSAVADKELEEMKKKYFDLLLLENDKPNRKSISVKIDVLEREIIRKTQGNN